MARLLIEAGNCSDMHMNEGETLKEKNERQEGVIVQLQEENQHLREMLKAAARRIDELEQKGKSVL